MSLKKDDRTPAAYAARAVRVLNAGRKAFISIDEFQVWLNTPHKELGDETPASLLFTAVGTERVMNELARLRAKTDSGSTP